MTFFSILERLLLGPLKLVFEIIFNIAYRLTYHPGLAVILLSLVINILVLPLYRRADAMQKEARETEAKLHDGVAHIKKHFSGDERMMILQAYYRQNHYKPTDALRGSVSLLLQIPFFIAAYQFLSHLEVVRGVSFGPIADLSAPDGLLVIGGVSINLLPILMTLVNVVSSALYAKGFPLKTKLQIYGLALFFLVFLYASPACLVFYWTLNNVFSLGKNIFYRLKNPQRVLRIFCAAIGLALLVFAVFFYQNNFNRKVYVCCVGLLLLLPLFLPELKKTFRFRKTESRPNQKLFLLGTVFLTILTGLLIPSAVIADSPQEFVDITYFDNPLLYMASSSCLAAGTFLIWVGIFYRLASPKGKRLFERLVWILCGAALVNYMFFGTDLGLISSSLQYINGMYFSIWSQIINLLVLAVVAAVLYFCVRKWERAAENLLIIFIVALSAMSVWNFVTIKASVDEISEQQFTEEQGLQFPLSTEGKNVIVVVLDAAMGEYIPYLLNEKPELKEKFDGFTYYANTISHAPQTLPGIPSVYGGYEYTPVEINKRDEEPLVSKHNEALKVMPAIFSENGYRVTVLDPPSAGYQEIPDLSIYDDYPGVAAYNISRQFTSSEARLMAVEQNQRNFFCFSIMKSMPLFLQPIIYYSGRYCQIESINQTRSGLSRAVGTDIHFINAYEVLVNLPNMTTVTTDETNTFFALHSMITHDPTMLQAPDYTPAWEVDNTAYDAEHADRFVVGSMELKMENDKQVIRYHASMAAMLQLGNWFDYLRENNVYHNSRIILVADHGQALFQLDELIMDEGQLDIGRYFPLLMVKDFNSEGFATSDTFMTNADVPTLAMKDIIKEPVNPFTGNIISDDKKSEHDQIVLTTGEWEITDKFNTTFRPATWASVRDNIWEESNWVFYDEPIVLNEYALP